jgi:hypothetical protein
MVARRADRGWASRKIPHPRARVDDSEDVLLPTDPQTSARNRLRRPRLRDVCDGSKCMAMNLTRWTETPDEISHG